MAGKPAVVSDLEKRKADMREVVRGVPEDSVVRCASLLCMLVEREREDGGTRG